MYSHRQGRHESLAVTRHAAQPVTAGEPDQLLADVREALTAPSSHTLTPQVVQRLQATHGNRFVSNLVTQSRHSTIQRELGGYQPKANFGLELKVEPIRNSANLDKFATKKSTLTDAHKKQIAEIAQHLKFSLETFRGHLLKANVVGHADTVGKDDDNATLGQARADAVKAELEQQLIKLGGGNEILLGLLVYAESAGEGSLANPTDDNVDEPLNRRVVVTYDSIPAPSLPPGGMPDAPTPGFTPLPGLPPPGPGIPGITPGMPWSPIPGIPKFDYRKQLEKAVEGDPLLKGLKKLSPDLYDAALDKLAEADEIAAEKALDLLPIEDKYKEALKAVAKALLQTLKGKKWEPPIPKPPQYEMPPSNAPEMPSAPGQVIIPGPTWKW